MARASAGHERILMKLNKSLQDNELYEAHQLYRTLYFRLSKSNCHAEAAKLMLEGANLFLNKDQSNSGADLAQLYVDVIKNDPQIDSKIQKSDFATEFAENIGSLYSRIIPKSPERLALVMAVMKLDDKRFPLPYINHLIANQLFKEQNYQDARYYYLNSAAYGKSNAADMLIEQHQKEGHPNEIDLFITQFVLQTLGRARAATVSSANTLGTDKDPSTIDLLDIKTRSIEHGYAITVFTAYVTRHPSIGVQRPMFPFPLLNFIYLLLIAVARGNGEEFKALRSAYQAALVRDEKFKQHLDSIGRSYFGLQPPPSNTMGGFLGNLLQQFMDVSDSDDESNSNSPGLSTQLHHSSQSTSGAQSLFTRLPPRAAATAASSNSRPSIPGSSSQANKSSSVGEQLDLD